jgi:hypothetical protein
MQAKDNGNRHGKPSPFSSIVTAGGKIPEKLVLANGDFMTMLRVPDLEFYGTNL